MGENNRNVSQTIGATSAQIAPELMPGERYVISIVNTSVGGQVISISIGQEAVAGVGIVLNPSGSWQESVDSAFRPTEKGFWAVSSAAGGTLAIHERIVIKGA